MTCDHNQRTRYTNGFQCNDKCGQWFPKDSPTYRKGEYMSSLWMYLHNVGIDLRANNIDDTAVMAMKDEIGIDIDHDNYEELITKAEALIKRTKLIEIIQGTN